MRLQPSSPAIDSGTCLAAVTQDFDGTPRPQGAACDMGAYEYFVPSEPPLEAGEVTGQEVTEAEPAESADDAHDMDSTSDELPSDAAADDDVESPHEGKSGCGCSLVR
jgi:hypothetical protein